jgi:predicted PhzF superfamily epimerase YddE/YHI9
VINRGFKIKPVFVGKDEKRYLVRIDDPEQLRGLQPDFDILKECDLGAFMITCESDREGFDFASRFFAPYVGIDEDPVTGSAHCYLAPYWGKILNKTVVRGFQESERTGFMECELVGESRVKLRGSAIMLYRAELIG